MRTRRAPEWLPSAPAFGLVGLMLLALGLRLAYAAAATKLPGTGGDDDWYHAVANLVADGHGFTTPFAVRGGHLVATGGDGPPTAFHPPLFSLLLSGVSVLGGRSFEAHQTAGCVLGALTVGGIGLLTRALAGDRAGLLAAALGAVSLPLIVNDSLLMSESLSGVVVVAALLAALGVARHPRPGRAALLGAAIGLAALARGEALLLLVLLAAPVCLRSGPGGGRRLAVAALACVAVVGPWTVRNAVRVHHLVPITTGDGTVVAGANAPSTYFGRLTGSWNIAELGGRVSGNEAVASVYFRRRGLAYARAHATRVPFVGLVRVLRTWGVWNPRDQRAIAVFVNGHIAGLEWWALGMHVALCVLAAVAMARLRRRVAHGAILLAPLALVTLASVLGYGAVRFRQPADVALVVLAALALDDLLRTRPLAATLRRPWPPRPSSSPRSHPSGATSRAS